MKPHITALAFAAATLMLTNDASAAGLRGSPASMRAQHRAAVEHNLTFMGNAAEVQRLAEDGGLVIVEASADVRLAAVSHPYAVPELRLLIERLGKQYREANGKPLVITSLVRPEAEQPRNAHTLSVHPAGMAVDLRMPQDAKERAWLESVLLELENAGVLDVTRERNPPHYHVAVFPAAYARYVERLKPYERAEAAVPVAIEPLSPHVPVAMTGEVFALAGISPAFGADTAHLTAATGIVALVLLFGVARRRLN